MTLTSSAFTDGKPIPKQFTCDGQNITPPLVISAVPTGAKSLALIMEDPDVPRNLRPDGLFIHWLVWNIPPSTKEIPGGAALPGVAGENTTGQIGYVGPCPPSGEHRYYFRLYALDTDLMIPSSASKAELLQAMDGHLIDQAELMGRYQRSVSV